MQEIHFDIIIVLPCVLLIYTYVDRLSGPYYLILYNVSYYIIYEPTYILQIRTVGHYSR